MNIDYDDVSSEQILEKKTSSASTSSSSSSSSSSSVPSVAVSSARSVDDVIVKDESNNNNNDIDDDNHNDHHDREIILLECGGENTSHNNTHNDTATINVVSSNYDSNNNNHKNEAVHDNKSVFVIDDDEIHSIQPQHLEIEQQQQQQQQQHDVEEEYFEDDYDDVVVDYHGSDTLHHRHHPYNNINKKNYQNHQKSSSSSRRTIRRRGYKTKNSHNNNKYSCIHHTCKTIASVTGNILEWYDFSILGFFSDILGMQFFPTSTTSTTSTTTTTTTTNQQQHNTGGHSLHHVHHFQQQQLNTMEAYAIFGIAFLMRPIGGMVVGYIGDVYGRKVSLELSIFAISITTTLMGCLPTYQQIGPGAILLLLIIRMFNGLCVGGQLMSSLVYTLESNPRSKWGLFGSTVMSASPFGFLMGGMMSYILRTNLTQQQLIKWGWRIPFLLGILVSFCGLYLKYCCPSQNDEIYVGYQRHIQQPIPQIDDDDDHHTLSSVVVVAAAAADRGGNDGNISDHNTMSEIENDSSTRREKECNIIGADGLTTITQASCSSNIGRRTRLQRRRPRIANGHDNERRKRQHQQRRRRKLDKYRGCSHRRLRTHEENDDDVDDNDDDDDDDMTTTTSRPNPLRLAFATENRRALFGAAFVPVLWSGGFYLCFVWLPMYMKNFVTPPIEDSFWINSVNLLVFCFEFPIIGLLSDYFGCRKRVMTVGALAFATLGPTSIVILGRYHNGVISSSSGSSSSSSNNNNIVDLLWIPFCCQLILTTSLACYGAPMCAWLVEAFEPKLRSTSVCIGYNIAQAIAGSISPILATILVQNVGIGAPGILLFVLSILSMIGLWCIAPQHSHHMQRTVAFHGSSRTLGTIAEPKEIC